MTGWPRKMRRMRDCKVWLSDRTELTNYLVSPLVAPRQTKLRSKLLSTKCSRIIHNNHTTTIDHDELFLVLPVERLIAPLALSPAGVETLQRRIMTHTFVHTEILQASADDIWEACKHVDVILTRHMPEFFAKSEYEKGHGEPGSIRVITMGPAVKHAGQVKERMDKFDDATKTLGYTVIQGDPRYSTFSAEMQFTQQEDGTTAGVWTAKYTPVGDMGPPEHVKAIVTVVMKTLEQAANVKKTLKHTETLEAAPDAIWGACRYADEILCKALPQLFTSSTLVQGNGGPGSIRVVKTGPGLPFADEVTERMDSFDHANKKMGYTVLKGDPRYHHMSATMQFSEGPRAGTTTALWVATYVPVGDMGPPEHIKNIVSLSWKALADAAAKGPPAAHNPVGVQHGETVPV